VIVVVDGSQDLTPKVIRDAERSGLVRGLRRQNGGGPAAARNLGWRAGTGRLVAFTDDDCEVDPEWLCALVPRLTAEAEHVAGVGGAYPAGP
jgi:glycosyltransferase involved in cell wall biosynthesis